MTLVRQIALIPAGCQPWNLNIVDSSGERFAYAATLAIYIYELNRESKQFYLHSIMSEHKKTICAIAWHPKDKDVLASSSTDYKICIWHVSKHKLLASLNTTHSVPSLMAWFLADDECIAYCDGKGPLYLWKYTLKNGKDGPLSHPLKEISSVFSNITQISWHPSDAGRFAMGHADGTISLYFQGKKPQKHVKFPSTNPDQALGAVSSLQWDPFSTNYLLVCTAPGRLQLVDSSTEVASVITTYSLPSKAVSIKCVAWLTEAPGAFVTGDAETGILRIWIVSKEKPEENFRLKQVGFKALCVLPSENKPATTTNGKVKFSARIVCLFFDGGVGVYNLRNSSWDFLRNMGHLETIFDCQFKPNNCDLLATASFDGTVKVWNVNTMEAVNSSHGDASIIYSLSWGPGDMDCLAAATSKSGIFVWNLKKGSIKKIENHEKGAYVYCVAWNQTDARKIASAGGDGFCMVHQVDGKLVQSFKHPSAVYGCDWNPNNENIVATACEDSFVRVYYVGSGTDQPLKVLSGHCGKVFRVKWSPLKDGILCSTSDDCSVRVWHYAQGIAVRILEGHTSYTRGILWCPELPNIIISGSWDSSIRVWDLSDGACLDVIEDHGADVYGLACHPKRPFVLASTSRDSTVRLWSVLPLVSSIYLKILASKPSSEIFCPSAIQSEDFDETPGLYGSQSKYIKAIFSIDTVDNLKKWREISALFCVSPPSDTANLWDLIHVLNEREVDYSSYKLNIVHNKHIIKLTTAKALEKELANVSFFGSGVNSCGKHENLIKAAELHLLTGNLRKYCEMKIQLGEWLEAIAVSPGVSIKYWNELCNRWLNVLMAENSSLVPPICIATNKSDELTKFYVQQNFIEKAHITSIAISEGLMQQCPVMKAQKASENNIEEKSKDNLVLETLKCLAERCMLTGYPVRAACWYLSDSQVQNALYCLIRGNELELAVSFCISWDVKSPSLKTALTYLAWRCVQKNNWELAIDILDINPDTELEKIRICISCGLSFPERDDLHKKAGLMTVKECGMYENTESHDDNCLFKIVQYSLLSDNPRKGLDVGLKYVKDALNECSWRLESLWQILFTMSSINGSVLQDISFDRQRFELQVYSAYIGALIAIRQGYHPIVVPLFSTALSLIRRVHNADLAISEDMVSSEMHAWVSSRNSTSFDDENIVFKEMMGKIEEDLPYGDIGTTIVSGSNLPRHSDHHRCYLRGTNIQGPVYFLDDSKSTISLNDALMWAKVNRFSPLKTGFTINPF
ncbi:LOW QUALITY PROTEIN: WD repeat-containing protein 17-like [Uloborus diversus]|uniref:LOW QUALITY PROTEIN: WD repeat-containing protein 17-like n=1 Tax=Uloborus diversus TaxID=327109 RepID=UPI002409A7CD|nr:LOW QUALITY PROTEIN: WD repeat-containing protein 17-like [Uloborus diversus]